MSNREFTSIEPVDNLLAKLSGLPTPSPKGRWSPISHFRALWRAIYRLTKEGYEIKGGTVALMDKKFRKKKEVIRNAKMWAMLLVTKEELGDNPELMRTVNIVNSHDKTMALELTIGAVVLKCMNGMWGIKQTYGVKKRHLQGENGDSKTKLTHILDEIVVELKEDKTFKQYLEFKNKLSERKYANADFAEMINNKILPIKDVEAAFDYKESSKCLWKGNTMWDFYNLFTQITKGMSMSKQLVTHKKLYNYFNSLDD